MKAQGVKVNRLCVQGVPPRELIAYAQKNGMDPIAVASHGRGEAPNPKVVNSNPTPATKEIKGLRNLS